ncbi:MAG: DUF1476 domain-containing protein [Rhodothalassiaceae bacterium]
MTNFDDRERAFETKFARDEETKFRVRARRDRLVGLWAAEKLGMRGEAAKDYAATVVKADFEEPGDEDVIRKLLADFQDKAVPMDRETLLAELIRQEGIAKQQLSAQE